MISRIHLLLLFIFLLGCSSSASDDPQSPEGTLNAFGNGTIELKFGDDLYSFPTATEFAGAKWEYVEAKYEANYLGVVAHYTSAESTDRLMYCICSPVQVQINKFQQVERIDPRNGQWTEHGACWVLYRNGGSSKSTYLWGEIEGWDRMWYANGQLRHETQYIHGQREGEGRGFWPDGSKQWEATYSADIEISGRSWEKGEEH